MLHSVSKDRTVGCERMSGGGLHGVAAQRQDLHISFLRRQLPQSQVTWETHGRQGLLKISKLTANGILVALVLDACKSMQTVSKSPTNHNFWVIDFL